MKSDKELDPGYYSVVLDLGEGELDTEWIPAEWDGRNWRVIGDTEVVYVAQIGARLYPREENKGAHE